MSLRKTVFIVALVSAVLLAVIVACTIPTLLKSGGEESEDGGASHSFAEPSALPVPETLTKPDNIDPLEMAVDIIRENKSNLSPSLSPLINDDSLKVFSDKFGVDKLLELADALKAGEVDGEKIYSIFGYTENALSALLGDMAMTTVIDDVGEETDIVFVGDTAFVDGWGLMRQYERRGKGVEGIVSDEILKIMRDADITMANNEFVLSTGGTPIPNKRYTLRGKPEYVNILLDMGVDIVGMANNHAFDYGATALTDTIKTLDDVGINHIGAGENLDEARAPYYYIIDGRVVAFIAVSTVDPDFTRAATDTQSGVFQDMHDNLSVEDVIKAKEKADIVVVFVHWGKESTVRLTENQKSLGHALVDAGADLIIGMHSHCMQGVEYYKGKMIAYSLGNFTFSNFTLTAGMVRTEILPDGELKNTFYPLMHNNNFTTINSGEKGKGQLASLRNLSINAVIADDFTVTPKQD